MELRWGNSGVDVSFALIECVLSIDLQPEVFYHPTLSKLKQLAGHMVFTINVSPFLIPLLLESCMLTARGLKDIYSYKKEVAGGHSANNLITVIKKERYIGVQEAFDVAGQFFESDIEEFLRHKELLPSWGRETDVAVSRYVAGLESWVGGSLEWSLTGRRYFGDLVEGVRKTRRVTLGERVV